MNNFEIELSRCDEEQIQFIATTQNFGSLLVADKNRKVIIAALQEQFRLSSEEVLGQDVDKLLPAITERVYAALEGRSDPSTPLLIRSMKLDGWVTCIAHRQDDLTILEIEMVPAEQNDIPSVKFMKERKDSLESYLSYIAENVRAATGYDRVMIYQFSPDWHGEVVAESAGLDVQRFYGHHFPASDIPAPARALFLQNWVRMIVDVGAEQLPLQGAGIKLDLTRSVLRAPANIHLEYLKNMGVAASLTLSLICDGKLWGLIACHHTTPKYVGAEQRSVLALVAKV
ncbi:MAG TPA: GAF domain-containing protein, partial [Chroococcales cyanobacterium]